jgi:uncharacterized membrane protein
MRTERGLDRLVFFTDAVAAIAITLLILPLVDSVAGEAAKSENIFEFLGSNLGQLGSFVLSFVVIARLWLAHHSLFEHVKAYSKPLMYLSLFWAFTIVLLPLPTAIIARFDTTWLSLLFYIGTVFLSSLALSGMTLVVHRDKSLEKDDNPLSDKTIFGSVATSAEVAVALILALTVPHLGFFAMLVLFAGGPVEAWADRRRKARAPTVAPPVD